MGPEARARPERILIVANPISGRGRGERAALALQRATQSRGIAAELHLTRGRGEARECAARAGADDLVVAVGGDGTLGEVLLGLPDPERPVGLLPCGTANVLAHGLGLSGEVEPALETFLGGRVQHLDVARVGERLAHLVVGVGFDAHVVQEVDERRRGPITKRSYLSASLHALRRYRPVPLRLWIDGEPLEEDVGAVWMANTARYADLLHLDPGTRLDDGQWEVYLFRTARLGELLAAFLRGLVAHLPGGSVTMRRARRLRIEAPVPVPVQVDGDPAGRTPVDVELLPRRYGILVP